MTDLSKNADGSNRKVTKPMELEGFRRCTTRTRRTSRTGLGEGARESMGCELCEPPKSESSAVHYYAHPPREQWQGSGPRR